MSKGSIALARIQCASINNDDDMSGSEYGSVDIAEILSAEIERLKERDAYNTDIIARYAVKFEQLTQDAQRYRWLRTKQMELSLPNKTVAMLVADQSELDAAMRGEQT